MTLAAIAMTGSRAHHRCCNRCGLSMRVCECVPVPARNHTTFALRCAGMGIAADPVTRGMRENGRHWTPESYVGRTIGGSGSHDAASDQALPEPARRNPEISIPHGEC